MCMLSEEKRATLKKPVWAWKCFEPKRGKLHGLYYPAYFKRGKWKKANKGPGFHTFSTEKHAWEYLWCRGVKPTVIRVQIRGKAVYGKQSIGGGYGWTAEEIFIPKVSK